MFFYKRGEDVRKKFYLSSIAFLFILNFCTIFAMQEGTQTAQPTAATGTQASATTQGVGKAISGELAATGAAATGAVQAGTQAVTGVTTGITQEAKKATEEAKATVTQAKTVVGQVQVEAKRAVGEVVEAKEGVEEAVAETRSAVKDLLGAFGIGKKQKTYPANATTLEFGMEVVLAPEKWLRIGKCTLLTVQGSQPAQVQRSKQELEKRDRVAQDVRWILVDPNNPANKGEITSKMPVCLRHKTTEKYLAVSAMDGKRTDIKDFVSDDKSLWWMFVSVTKVPEDDLRHAYREWVKGNFTTSFVPSTEEYELKEGDDFAILNPYVVKTKDVKYRFLRAPRKAPLRPKIPGQKVSLQHVFGPETKWNVFITLPMQAPVTQPQMPTIQQEEW